MQGNWVMMDCQPLVGEPAPGAGAAALLLKTEYNPQTETEAHKQRNVAKHAGPACMYTCLPVVCCWC